MWVVFVLLAVAGVWAQSTGGGAGAAARAFVYLALCGGVLLLPGYLLGLAGVKTATLRIVSLVIVVVCAGLAAGTIVAGALWATPPLILLAGNAIWTLDTIDLESELRRRRPAPPPA
jgi:hypothetical protein